MSDVSRDLDWSLVQAFLAVADTGSLSAAARSLGASQPTLGRQIKAMERQLNTELFTRQPRGLTLTKAGADMIGAARKMADAMQQISLTAAGKQQDLSGTVRITTSEMNAFAHMPAIIADMRDQEPQIEIELVPSDASSNLLYREADIAIRMYRPKQLDLIARHIGDISLGAFAAKSYLASHGVPTVQTLNQHSFVGYDAQTDIIDGFAQAGITIDRHFFGVRCDDQVTYWQLVRAGCGIGFAQNVVGQGEPLVDPVDLGFPIPPLPVWLTAHEAMRQTPRVRRVWDMLVVALAPLVS